MEQDSAPIGCAHDWVAPTSVNGFDEKRCGRCGMPYRLAVVTLNATQKRMDERAARGEELEAERLYHEGYDDAMKQAEIDHEAHERAFRACVEALRRYGFDHGGVWHEFGCPGWNTPSLSMCGPRCVQGRDALALAQAADTEQEGG